MKIIKNVIMMEMIKLVKDLAKVSQYKMVKIHYAINYKLVPLDFNKIVFQFMDKIASQ
jgi:hypothetical protein